MIDYQDLLSLLVDTEALGAAVFRPSGDICRANSAFRDPAQQWTVDDQSHGFLMRAARTTSPIVGSISLTSDTGESRKIACNARGFLIPAYGVHVLARESRAQRDFAEQTGHFRTLELELEQTGAELSTLRTVFDATPDAVLVLGMDRSILRANPAAVAMFGGVDRAAAFARNLDLQGARPHRREEETAAVNFELTARRGERHFPVEITAQPARVSGEDVWITCIRDLSDRKGLERALQRASLLEEARDRAEQARLAKTRFLATVSHELRTPLHGVNSALELVLSRMAAETGDKRLIELAYRSCEAALEQVNRILEISRIEGRDLTEHPRRLFDLVATVADVCNETRLIAERKSIEFETHLPAEPVLVDSFEHLVRQLVQNLISNAIKFTNEGRVSVSFAVERDMLGDTTGILTVQDSGVGFDIADLSRLKQEFETGDASFRRIEDGAGLGLALVEQALEALEGSMEVQSERGVGSRFAVRIPLRVEAGRPRRKHDVDFEIAREAEGLLILLAEDNEINAEILKELLESLGAEVQIAENGAQAIASARAHPYDIILMDVSMPEVDGMTATREIRNDGENREALIVGLTAHCDPEVRAACRDAGMDDVHTKPISIAKLRSILRGEITGDLATSSASIAQSSSLPAPGSPPKEPPATDMRAALGPEKFKAYRGKLLGQLDGSLAEFSSLLAVAAFDPIAKLAHKHIGAVSFLGEQRLVAALRSLEKAAQDKSAGACSQSVAALQELVERMATPD